MITSYRQFLSSQDPLAKAAFKITDADQCEFIPPWLSDEVINILPEDELQKFIYKPSEKPNFTQAYNLLEFSFAYRCNGTQQFVGYMPEAAPEPDDDNSGLLLAGGGLALRLHPVGWLALGVAAIAVWAYSSNPTLWRQVVRDITKNKPQPNLDLDPRPLPNPEPWPKGPTKPIPLIPEGEDPDDDCKESNAIALSYRSGGMQNIRTILANGLVPTNNNQSNLLLKVPVKVYLQDTEGTIKDVTIREVSNFQDIRGYIIKNQLSSHNDFKERAENYGSSHVLVAEHCGKIVGILAFSWDRISRADNRKIMNINVWERFTKEYNIPNTGVALFAVFAMAADVRGLFNGHVILDPSITSLTTGAANRIRNFFGINNTYIVNYSDVSEAARANVIGKAEFNQLITNIPTLNLQSQ